MSAKKKILGVDDDASVCDLYEKILPGWGYEVHCASSARQARSYLEKEKPDLILMDVMMPDEDGISLTREIRGKPGTSHIPILIVSGLSDAATLNDALLFGAADYMVKPISPDILKSKIERALTLKDRRKR